VPEPKAAGHRNRTFPGKCICIALFVAVVLCIPAVFARSEGGEVHVVRVVMDNNYPPYIFPGDNGKIEGILIDQWRLWEKKTGIRAEISAMDWGEAQDRMKKGEFDVIDTLFFNEERARIYDFSKPYTKIDVPIFFHKDIPGISGTPSLKGFFVAVKAGDAAIDFLRRQGISDLVEFNSYESVIEACKNRRITVFVIDKPPALYYLYKTGLYEQFRFTEPLYTGEFHRAVRKGNHTLLELVEKGFSQITPAEYEAIDKRWYGTGLAYGKYLRYGFLVAVLAAILFLLLVAWNHLLRKKVLEKTAELSRVIGDLRKSEEKYRDLVEHSNSIILRIDRQGNITFINEFAEAFFQVPGKEVLGQNIIGTLVAERESTRGEIKRIIEDLFASPERYANYVNEITRSKGERAWIAWAVKPVRDGVGNITEMLCIGNDITARKRVEEAFRESEEKYRLLVQNSHEAIFIAQDGVIKFPNRKTLTMTGYTEEELAAMPFSRLIHPEDRDMVTERYKRRLSGEPITQAYAFRILDHWENMLWVELNAVLVSWEGRPASLNFVRDITDKRNMEEQLLRSRNLEAMGTLAGGIAHDFNNLLMGIQGHASLMKLDADPGDPAQDRLKNIEELVKSGADLTRQLLAFARGGRYEVKPTDLNALIRKTLNLFGRTRKEISVHLDLEEDLLAVDADGGQIEQALINLYVNAWQAMPSGGDLFLETRNVTLDDKTAALFGLPAGDYARVSVTDTGVGMDGQTMSRIFEPFFTTREMGRGTGLGLASVYGIVRSHQGMIHVSSEKGKGTTFTIHLPASGKKIRETADRDEKIRRGSETVLVVDDETFVTEVTGKMLKRLGYQVLTAANGADALKIYGEKGSGIDLVILDMIMPEMSGQETFRRLKSMNPGVRAILSSGYSIDGQARSVLNEGCAAFLQKPFTLASLSEKIREVLDREAALAGDPGKKVSPERSWEPPVDSPGPSGG
jgi:PAS domain S-box-containing protein